MLKTSQTRSVEVPLHCASQILLAILDSFLLSLSSRLDLGEVFSELAAVSDDTRFLSERIRCTMVPTVDCEA